MFAAQEVVMNKRKTVSFSGKKMFLIIVTYIHSQIIGQGQAFACQRGFVTKYFLMENLIFFIGSN